MHFKVYNRYQIKQDVLMGTGKLVMFVLLRQHSGRCRFYQFLSVCLCLYLNRILRAKYFEYTVLHLVSVVLVLFILLVNRNLDVVALGCWLCHERVIPF